MKNTLRFGIISLAALVAFLMIACDDGADDGEEAVTPGGISVTVAPKAYIVHRGYDQSFIAAVKGTDDKAVIWSIEGNGLHANTTIDQKGLLSVSRDEEQTTLTIKAVLAADETKYGTAAVSIPAPVVTGVDISLAGGVELFPWFPKNKAIDVDVGKTEQFQAKVTGENFPVEDVTWSITGDVASGTSIDEDGVLTVSPNEAQDKIFTVKAASKVDPTKTDIIAVTVRTPTINFFKVIPSDTVISPFNPVEFTIAVLGSGNIQGLYAIERTVKRSDDPPNEIAQEGDIEYKDRDNDGNLIIVTIHDKGTRFEGNVLHMSPFEYWGDLDENDEVFTEIDPFFFNVTITVTSETLAFSPSVQPEYGVSLTPDHGIVESTDVFMKESF
jgi:hypothetical protein